MLPNVKHRSAIADDTTHKSRSEARESEAQRSPVSLPTKLTIGDHSTWGDDDVITATV